MIPPDSAVAAVAPAPVDSSPTFVVLAEVVPVIVQHGPHEQLVGAKRQGCGWVGRWEGRLVIVRVDIRYVKKQRQRMLKKGLENGDSEDDHTPHLTHTLPPDAPRTTSNPRALTNPCRSRCAPLVAPQPTTVSCTSAPVRVRGRVVRVGWTTRQVTRPRTL